MSDDALENVTRTPLPGDDEAVLMIPPGDVESPEVSIVIPAMNEEAVVSEFLDWCHEGIAKAGVVAEILIIDSSTDRTPDIALAKGARVLKTPCRGLGRAYQDATPVIRGKYVILGDADCTYDFREMEPFLQKFRAGHQFIMGSRFKGTIEDGAMPALHRFFGTPLTNFLLNLIYGSRFSDIHCGMRGITLAALKAMNIRSQSWEYASEMVVKSVRMSLDTVEVPVKFYKDRHGRVSHHKRVGWFSPWHAGWINLRAMLIYGADFFVMKPGAVLLAIGLVLTLGLSAGPLTISGITFSLNTMWLGATLSIIGLQSIFLGCMAETLYDPTGRAKRRWLKVFPYTPTVVAAGLLFCVGLALGVNFAAAYSGAGFTVFAGNINTNHLAVTGLVAIVLSFLTFVSTLLLHAIAAYAPDGVKE
ncbi:MAG: glycosyltransferase family 2 protein [Alphaproteobacteria bacterium]|jgi:glycosyltransferase involved in cell wall biosynthesis|nr:glycosyltransferase family 2 protein [Alphaproteobacteria bacterium]